MSILQIIKESLAAHPQAEVISCDEHHNLNPPPNRIIHEVKYHVVPKEGLYCVDRLQQFMINLIPNINHLSKDDFRITGNSYKILICGYLEYQEKIGEEKRIFAVNYDEVYDDVVTKFCPHDNQHIESYNLEKGVYHITARNECWRRIKIGVSPDSVLAKKWIYEGQPQYSWKQIQERAQSKAAALSIVEENECSLSFPTAEQGIVSFVKKCIGK